MIQYDLGVAQPRNKNVIKPPTNRPKGAGRRKPHCGVFTRGMATHTVAKTSHINKKRKLKLLKQQKENS